MLILPEYIYQKLADDRNIRILALYPPILAMDTRVLSRDSLKVKHRINTWEFLRARARLNLETNKAYSIPSKLLKYGHLNEAYCSASRAMLKELLLA